MQTDLRQLMLRLFGESRFIQSGVFDHEYVHQLINEHLPSRADHDYRLWTLINLEFWYRIYFDNEYVTSLRASTDRIMAR